jgi:hypothetical protein
VLPPLPTVDFLAILPGLLGIDLGCSFAPNHKPCWPWVRARRLTSSAARSSPLRKIGGGSSASRQQPAIARGRARMPRHMGPSATVIRP